MQVVDTTGVQSQINEVVYRSMKDKLDKYEQVLFNLQSEIRDADQSHNSSVDPHVTMSASRDLTASPVPLQKSPSAVEEVRQS